MKISVCQIYIEPGVSFPFSHVFQARVGSILTKSVGPQALFEARYGKEYDLIFNISAKQALVAPEVKGPAVFKRWKTVEYTIFLPCNTDKCCSAESLRTALALMFESIRDILRKLGMTCAAVDVECNATISDILLDESMTNC